MNHNDVVRQSFKKQAEKFVAYHMSKKELPGPVFVAGLWLLM